MLTKREDIQAALAEPFDPEEIKWKPSVVNGNRALALAYIDARLVMDRLDYVVGLGNWQTAYQQGDDGVVCRLTVRIEGEWVVHEDFGGWSKQPDDGDKTKAAFSDALKRVAIHFGIGRYLYGLPQQWVDYDPQKKRIVSPPRLPDWARPAGKRPQQAQQPAPAPQPQQQPQQQPAAKNTSGKPAPRTGKEFAAWLEDAERASGGVFCSGELKARVHKAVLAANVGTPLVMDNWAPALVEVGVGLARNIFRDRKDELEAIKVIREDIAALLEDAGATWDGVKEHHCGTGPDSQWSLGDWEETLRSLREKFDAEVF